MMRYVVAIERQGLGVRTAPIRGPAGDHSIGGGSCSSSHITRFSSSTEVRSTTLWPPAAHSGAFVNGVATLLERHPTFLDVLGGEEGRHDVF